MESGQIPLLRRIMLTIGRYSIKSKLIIGFFFNVHNGDGGPLLPLAGEGWDEGWISTAKYQNSHFEIPFDASEAERSGATEATVQTTLITLVECYA